MTSPCCLFVFSYVTRQLLGKHFPAVTNTHAAIEEFFDLLFSIRPFLFKCPMCTERKVQD
jgi:hypothetical protein